MIAQIDKSYVKIRPTKAISRLISYALFEGRPLTTKGQWINPLVFFHFELEKRLPQLKRVLKPIFIVGTGRSGTTLLGFVLSTHRDVGFLNEPKALWHSIYKEEDIIGSYCQGIARYRLDATHATMEVQRAAHRLFGAYLTAVAAKRVVGKYPEMIFRVRFVRAIFPDAKFIFLVRNGWDACHSIVKWSERFGMKTNNEIHDWWGVNNRKWRLLLTQLITTDNAFSGIVEVISGLRERTDMAVIEWILTMREGLFQMEQNPDCIYMARYEELTKNPRSKLADITKFCELESDERFFAYAERAITPTSAHPKFDVHPAVLPLFEKTMEQLGY